MKKILFLAISATLLAAGCQKTEVLNRLGDSMTFTTEMSKLTKADSDLDLPDAEGTGVGNLQAQNFKVWAYAAYNDSNNGITAGAVYDGMSALDVTYDTSWSTEKEYYWPGTDKSLDFFAVSTEKWSVATAPEVVISGQGQTDLSTRKLEYQNYSVDSADPNDDLMVAEFVRQDQSQNSKKVNLHFKHALAKVTFKFKTLPDDEDPATPEPPTVIVKSLIVKGLKTTGTLTVTPATTQSQADETTTADLTRTPVKLAWNTESSATDDFSDDYSTSYHFPEGTENTDNDDDAMLLTSTAQPFTTWLVMPQTIASKQVEVKYVINKREFTTIFDLTNEGAVPEWAINQAITYTVTLAPNVISFNPTVEDWDIYDADADTNGDQDVDMMN